MRMVKTLDDMTAEDKWKDAGCPKCGCHRFDTRDVDEVDGMAVGPWTIFECEDCMYVEYQD